MDSLTVAFLGVVFVLVYLALLFCLFSRVVDLIKG